MQKLGEKSAERDGGRGCLCRLMSQGKESVRLEGRWVALLDAGCGGYFDGRMYCSMREMGWMCKRDLVEGA